MANSSTRKDCYTPMLLLFFVLFLFSLFLFSRRTLENTLSVYRDAVVEATPFHPFAAPSNGSHISLPDNNERNSLQDFVADPKQTDSSRNQSVSGNAQTEPIEPLESKSSNDSIEMNEISVNDKNDMINEISIYDKNDMVSDNESTGDMGDNGPDLAIQSGLDCDLYVGTWVKDENYPIYKPGSCPYVDEAYDCQTNGRLDTEFTKWRWKPDGCHLPRFNATDFLVRLRGKRLMLVGDSMNRNQFESILCVLREGLQDKRRMREVHGYKITKGRGNYVFKFEDYDCTVEFVRSHFLVREGIRINGKGNSNPTLSIDRMDKTSDRWKTADILVFNTGHWWTHGKTARGVNYYKEGNHLYPKFDAVEAYRRAIKTWAEWVDKNINPQKQTVYYRGYSSAHFRGGDWDSGGTCNGETEPTFKGQILDNYPLKMKIVEEVIKKMKFPVMLLNVTKMTNFRKDGHPSIYGKINTSSKKVSKKRQDCSHWCLPGVPDAWNELIYATMVFQQTDSRT